ncbi:MAG: alpha/beta hydrolase [Chitinophagales bacterium]|nr:alpha/beta hydrolase [Chitinophagales bacterium]
MKELEKIITGSDGEKILMKYFIPENISSPHPIVLIHGFKGFMDWGHFPYVARKMAEKGNVVIRFNFSHDGTSPATPSEFSRLDLFAQNTYSKELTDIKSVLDEIESLKILLQQNLNTKEIYLIGHSRGGADAIITAFEDNRIKKLVTWASVDRLATYFADDADTLAKWKKEGVVYIYNSRTGQNMPMNYSLYEDAVQNKERFDVHHAAQNLNIPWLIVHGDTDPTVDVEIAYKLYQLSASSDIYIMPQAHHNFGAKHPLDDSADFVQINLLVDKTLSFLMS